MKPCFLCQQRAHGVLRRRDRHVKHVCTICVARLGAPITDASISRLQAIGPQIKRNWDDDSDDDDDDRRAPSQRETELSTVPDDTLVLSDEDAQPQDGADILLYFSDGEDYPDTMPATQQCTPSPAWDASPRRTEVIDDLSEGTARRAVLSPVVVNMDDDDDDESSPPASLPYMADEDEDDAALEYVPLSAEVPRVAVAVRWNQYTDDPMFRYRAYVPASMTVRQLFLYLAREYNNPQLRLWYGDTTTSSRLLMQDDTLGDIATNGELRIDSAPKRIPDAPPFDFDNEFWGRSSRQSSITFTIEMETLDAQCDIPPIQMSATWSQFLSSAIALCPVLRGLTPSLAGRRIETTSAPSNGTTIAASDTIWDTLGGFVYDPMQVGVRIHFE